MAAKRGGILRRLLILAGAAVVLVVAVLGLAYAFIPREWINEEAQRQAAAMSGAAVSWKTLEPGFDGLSLGIRLRGLAVTMPKQGDPRLDLRAREVFVRFRILPLLFRRVEIAAAKVKDAGIATWDRGPLPQPAGGGAGGGGMALVLPKLELDGVDVRTRDLYGGGVDLRRIHGAVEIGGTLEKPSAVQVDAMADSLFWKASARDPLLPMPSPLRVALTMKGAAAKPSRLDVTQGTVSVGPLQSTVAGSITMPPAPAPMQMDLTISGKPQEIKSSDAAFRAFAAKSPASWAATAAWDVKVGGTSEASVQTGSARLAPIHVESGPNKFTVDEVRAEWRVTPDKRFTANADGKGSGLTMRLDMGGSTEPGGASNGMLRLDAPAVRLNGLMPNAPTWTGGALDVVAQFATRGGGAEPPAVTWTVHGRDLAGTAPGVQPPIKRLQFTMEGDMARARVSSLDATVGSTTAHATADVVMGKPLGTADFTATLDRFVAEEWAPPKGAAPAPAPAAKPAGSGAAGGAAGVPPIPFRRLAGKVTIGELQQAKMVVRDVTVPMLYENGTLSLDPIRGAMGTGTLAGAVTVKDLATKPSYAVKLDVVKAPVEELARGMIPFKLGLSGLMSGNVDLSGPGLPGPEVTDSLRGSLSGTIEDGKIAENPGLRSIQGLLGLGGANADGLPFKTLSHVLRIERGRLILDKVKGDLGVDKFELTGGLGLDKSMNLGLLVRLAPERVKGNSTLAKFAALARDSDGRLPLELGIGGTTDAPKVQIKAGKLLDVAGRQLKESLTRKLGQTLEKKLAPPPAPARTDSTGAANGAATGAATDTTHARPDSTKAEDPLKGALRRLLGK